ncbi:MAG: carbon-nitrogen hydrolase family protein [Acidobacteriota bacterium]
MKWILVLLSIAVALAESPNLAPEAAAWKRWSPLPELAPQSEAAGGMLRIAARDFSSFGKWLAPGIPVQAGHSYRFDVLYRPEGIADDRTSVGVMLSWIAADGHPIQRDYIDRISQEDAGWRRAQRTLRAPAKTASVTAELWLRWTASGSVQFKDPRLVEVPAPAARKVRVVTTKITEHRPTTIAENLKFMAEVVDGAAREHPDVILLTEVFVNRGVAGKPYQLAQPIPGPATEVLAEKARRYKSYIIAGLLESDHGRTYNTAVLLDREGRLAGKYRKTHLPLAEVEDGITAGSDYPVFDTDFGRIGILICWDVVFPEPMRILRLKGAEVIFLPIAGDPAPGHLDTITRARAMDNGIFLITSISQELGSRIVDPDGRILAETKEGYAGADLDLDKETRFWWMSVGPADGEPRSLFLQERRPDTYRALSGQ